MLYFSLKIKKCKYCYKISIRLTKMMELKYKYSNSSYNYMR